MAFYKKIQQKINGKWYPQAVTAAGTMTTDEVAERLSEMSTLTPGDAYAVLKNLAHVLTEGMSAGRAVKLDGLGTFRYTCVARGEGVDSPEEVNPSQITGIHIRFTPERSYGAGRQCHRKLVDGSIQWIEWGGL
ncbi:MAG: HU family DNA-binding protein [Prevotellaceae bacterium]|jgi:predicted histone-like DNA-binding protein|nr:HU family DNA-binding protein [Prevotellaceae bacterium]